MSILFMMIAGALFVSAEELLDNCVKRLLCPRVIFNRGGRYRFN